MPKLKIDGVGTVEVGDNFLQLSPEDQQRTVDEIRAAHSSRAAQPEDPRLLMGQFEPTSGTGRYLVNRGMGLISSTAKGIDQAGDALARAVTGQQPDKSIFEEVAEGIDLEREKGFAAYKDPGLWQKFKDDPSASTLLSFAAHEGLGSVPDMVASITSLPRYVLARVGGLAEERAKNDGRSVVTGEDLAAALATSTASSTLERVGARGIRFPTGGNFVTRAVGAGAKEAGTEFAQEMIDDFGTTAGTETGFDAARAAEKGLAGAVAGGTYGAGFEGAIDAGRGVRAIPGAIGTIRAGMELDANPDQTLSDIRVGRMHEQELADVQAAHTGNEPLDTTVLKNVKVELKRRLTDIVRGLHRNGDIDNEARATLLRNADSIMDASGNGLRELTQSDLDAVEALGLSPEDTQGLQRAFRDLNSITANAKQKNMTGPFQRAARVVGPMLAHGTGQTVAPGFPGAVIGGLTSRMAQNGLTRAGGAVDRFFGLQRPDVLRRYEARVRAAQNRGIDPGDTRAFLTDIEGRIGQRQQIADSEAAARVQRERQFRAARRAADNPGLGGWDRETFDRTGLRPRQVDAGLDHLVQAGTITAEQAESFKNTPEDFQGTRTGMLIQDHLDELAAQGVITRDANWRDPRGSVAPAQGGANPVRNPQAYQAGIDNRRAHVEQVAASAPSPELATAAQQVHGQIGRAEKNAVVDAALAANPQHAQWIEQNLRPLTEYGQQAQPRLREVEGPLQLPQTSEAREAGLVPTTQGTRRSTPSLRRPVQYKDAGDLDAKSDAIIETIGHKLEEDAFAAKERKRVDATKLAHKVRKSDGSYRGAPEGVTSPAALGHLRKSLYNLASEGKEGRFWYERSGRAILNAVGGNKVEAEKLAQLVAIYSQSTPVKSNFDYALQAYAQYQQTGEIRTGRFPTEQSKRAQAVMDGTPWEGRKTNNFYVNLMREIDPKSVQGVTADIWMMRAFGYKGKDGKAYSGSPTDAQYDFVERETEKVMERLNADLAPGEPQWEPQQVQAAIWIAEKANHEGTSVHDAAYDYSTALEGALAQISWESIPGKTSGELPEMFNAPYSQRAEYHVAISKAFLDAKGGDIVAKALGVLSPGEFEAPGYFEGNTNPGSQTKVAAPRKYLSKAAAEIEPANVEQIDAYAIAKGILLKQDAMAWHRPFFSPKQKDANGAEVRIGRTLSAEENARLGENLAKVFGMGDIGPIGSEKGARLLNLGYLGIPNKDFQSKVQKAVDMTFGDDPSITPEIGLFAYQGNYITNDWSKSPNGEEYYAALAQGRSDLQRKVRDVVAKVGPRIEAIQEEFAQRYGWTRRGSSERGVLAEEQAEQGSVTEPILTE
jgi:hypothetical protein